MDRQKVVDGLGVFIPCGVFVMCHIASTAHAWLLLCLELLFLLLSGVRIVLFRSTPKNMRRRYNMNLCTGPWLLGRDVLFYPYTQAGMVVVFLFPILTVLCKT